MPNLSAIATNGDPLQLVIYWGIVAFAFLVAWFVLAVAFLPFYFGIKAAIDAVVGKIRGGAQSAGELARQLFQGIAQSFSRLGTTAEVKVFLLSDIRALARAVDETRSTVSKSLKKFQRVTQRAAASAGGVPGVMRRVHEEIDRLHTVPQLDAESIKIAKGRSVAWFRAILITAFWIGIVALNTVMLHEFFKGLVPLRIPIFGINLEIAWAISVFYTFVEFIFGFLLERANEKREAVGGVGAMQLVLVPFILIAIFVEVALYTILSFDIQWAWPDAIAASIPAWADGWLGMLGLVIGGGVVFSGYFMGAQWAEVLRGGSVISMKAQARLLSDSLDSLPERLGRLKEAVDAVQGKLGPEANDALAREHSNFTTSVEQRVGALRDRLDAIDKIRPSLPPIEEASNHEVNRFRWKVLAFGVGGVVAVLGNVLLMTTALAVTEIGNLGPYAPPAFAVVATILMLFAGRVSASILVVTHGRVTSNSGHEQQLTGHGLGVTQWAGVILAALLLVFSGWAGTSGFRSIDAGGLSSSLAVNVATFMVGAFLEDIIRGLAFFGEVIIRTLAAGLLGSVALIALVGSLLVSTLLFLIELVAGPAIWLWRTIRGRKGGRQKAHPSIPEPRQIVLDADADLVATTAQGEVRA